MSDLGTGLPGSRPITVISARRGRSAVSSERTKRSALVVTMTTCVGLSSSETIWPARPG